MRQRVFFLAFCSCALTVLVSATSCRSVPMTGRKQLLVTPEQQEVSMGLSSYQEILQQEKETSNKHYAEIVNRVGQRIAAVADRPDYQWEFRVIESSTQNAFCLPGGKVAVYEGILPICETEAGLAVVMSHEIAHALARHGGERMSQGMAVNMVGTAVSYVTRNQEKHRQEMINKAYALGSKYGYVLPYSRKHETEADEIGLMLMAKAGYDPREAPRFWERFGRVTQGGATPEFMSTHPASQRRAQDLMELMPEAVAVFEKAPDKVGRGQPLQIAGGAPPAAQLQPNSMVPQGPGMMPQSMTPRQAMMPQRPMPPQRQTPAPMQGPNTMPLGPTPPTGTVPYSPAPPAPGRLGAPFIP